MEDKREEFFNVASDRFDSAEDRDILAGLKVDSGRALADRRRLVHGMWAFGVTIEAPIFYREAKKSGAARPKPWCPKDIDAAADSIHASCTAIIRFLEDRGIAAPPLPNR